MCPCVLQVYEVHIEQLHNGKWVPFKADDVQYVRQPPFGAPACAGPGAAAYACALITGPRSARDVLLFVDAAPG